MQTLVRYGTGKKTAPLGAVILGFGGGGRYLLGILPLVGCLRRTRRTAVDTAIKALMLAKGYVAEGYGPDAVAMCAPQ